MNDNEMTALVETYFAGVDGEDFDVIKATMTDDCVFTVETHGIELTTMDDIRSMFDRLWASHTSVQHTGFSHIVDVNRQRVSSQFKVVNTHHDGSLAHKSNCNFFDIRDGLFSRISVYMAGENTLNKA
ncbi:MAG: SnoaL-like domain-containing protein [Alphaproteobacteria bacterium]|jgi:ketosteroid isomerase-like protein|nr:SnoaL-like domain-containing protein [Alphaproteobacteria bacterium]MBT4019809.1 SnoaL-like domain-containing protein [Alphaproteobacteria bacterium]MBT4966191.1 SnoaL-like domain-containing protein [Alphaproteobacteria bacterium]MBT5158616.1 SnoaL-like domain-containing protein [Alphaproteobacteria bacterium]MBT5917634.1 SnoaL-like domain-containing protein [Alphaproteobacteria bacterium]